MCVLRFLLVTCLRARNTFLASSNGNKYVTEDPDLLAEVGTEKELIRRQFFAEVEEIRERIEKLQANVEEVKLKHSAILTAWNINEEMNNELEDFQADMKETFNETIEMLKHMEQSIEIEVERQSNKIGADSSNLNRPKNKSANLRMRITQHAALWHKFVEVMTEYNSAQADYRDRCENWKLRQLAITHQNVSEQELKTLLEQNNPSLFTNGGEMVNRIEFHVNNSVENIEDGLDDVEDAVNIVYSNRRVNSI
ncbi:syntaxin-1B-like isoform X4 [Choristoneura fumiferana]|uniref:syntaxin-1B-like isoform X4 n=1 Tax=Choristoneura fumiferana TaxID=7141 RepID=UPI003D15528F